MNNPIAQALKKKQRTFSDWRVKRCGGRRDIGTMKGLNLLFLVLKMEGPIHQEMPLEVESNPQLTIMKEMGNSVLYPYGTEKYQQFK